MPNAPEVSNRPCGVASQAEYHWPESEFYVSQQHRLVYCPIQKVACSSLKLWWAELLEGETAHFYSTNEKGLKYLDHGRLNVAFKLHHQPGHLGRQPVTEDGWFRFVFVRNPWARLVSVFINKFFKYHALAQPVYEAAHRRWNKHPLRTAGRMIRQAVSPFSAPRGLRTTIWPLLRGTIAWRDELTFRHFIDFLASQGLDNAVNDLHWMPQYRFLGDTSFHFIGRFERLDQDLRTISDLLGIQATLPVVNATRYARQGELPARCFANTPLTQLRRLPSMPDYRMFYTAELAQQVASLYRRDIEQFGYDFDN